MRFKHSLIFMISMKDAESKTTEPIMTRHTSLPAAIELRAGVGDRRLSKTLVADALHVRRRKSRWSWHCESPFTSCYFSSLAASEPPRLAAKNGITGGAWTTFEAKKIDGKWTVRFTAYSDP